MPRKVEPGIRHRRPCDGTRSCVMSTKSEDDDEMWFGRGDLEMSVAVGEPGVGI